jgi:hypothetical protein
MRHLPGLTTSYAESSALTGYHRLGPLYDGDAVHTDGRRPEHISPAAPIHKTGFIMALRTHHATLAGDTLPMDLQVRSCTRQVYRHSGVSTQGGIDEGDRVPAGIGEKGAGRGQQVGMHFRQIGNNEWRTPGVLDSGHSGGKGGVPPLRHGAGLITAMRARNYGRVRAIIKCTTLNAYAWHHLVWAEQYPGIQHPGRREPSLCGLDCIAVLHPCWRRIKTPIG